MNDISGLHVVRQPALNAKILVLSQKALERKVIARFLRQAGYRNLMFHTFRELLVATVEASPPELVLLDDEHAMIEPIFSGSVK